MYIYIYIYVNKIQCHHHNITKYLGLVTGCNLLVSWEANFCFTLLVDSNSLLSSLNIHILETMHPFVFGILKFSQNQMKFHILFGLKFLASAFSCSFFISIDVIQILYCHLIEYITDSYNRIGLCNPNLELFWMNLELHVNLNINPTICKTLVSFMYTSLSLWF